LARISRLFEPVTTHIDDILWRPDEELEHVYFPTSGCLSVISVVQKDLEVEVGTIGWEGMAGLSLLHRVTKDSTKCIAQIDGTVLRLTSASFAELISENAEFLRLVHRYAQFWSEQSARSIACNGVHSVTQRCARWLLMTQDRVGSTSLPLSHKFLAIMLGVRRASVSVAAKSLREAGLITYTRAKVTILDRAGLLAASCSCYAAIGASYTRLLPPPTSSPRT
jgi:CRP-like cAMP-binding protein